MSSTNLNEPVNKNNDPGVPSWRDIIIFLSLLLIFITLIIGIWMGIKSRNDYMATFRANGAVTIGTVINITKIPALDNTWKTEYEYQVDGKRFTGYTQKSIYQPKIGKAIGIVYFADNPGKSELLDKETDPNIKNK